MFDSTPRKSKVTPPTSPLRKVKSPFSRTGSPVSFRARSTARATLLVLALVVLISVLNEMRCEAFGCQTRVGFREGFEGVKKGLKKGEGLWEGARGGSVLPAKSSGGKPGQDHDEDEGFLSLADEAQVESKLLIDGSEGSGWKGEAALIDPGPEADMSNGKEAGKGRWLDDKDPMEGTLEKDAEKLGTLIPGGVAPLPPPATPATSSQKEIIDREKQQTEINSKDNSPSWVGRKGGPPRDEMKIHFKPNGDSGGDQSTKWKQGEGQEDPVRVPTHPESTKAKSETEAVALVGEESKAGDKSEGAGDGGQGGGDSMPKFGAMMNSFGFGKRNAKT